MKTSSVDLAERSGSDRVNLKFRINFVYFFAQLMLDPGKGDLILKRRHLINESSQLGHKRQRQKIGTCAHRLAYLDKGRSEAYELFLQPNCLFLLISFPIF